MFPTVTYPVLIPMPIESSSSRRTQVERSSSTFTHLERGRYCPLSMILERDRVAEEGENAVTQILVQGVEGAYSRARLGAAW